MNIKSSIGNLLSKIYFRSRITSPFRGNNFSLYHNHQIYHFARDSFVAEVSENNVVVKRPGMGNAEHTIVTASTFAARRLLKRLYNATRPWYVRLTRRVAYIGLAVVVIGSFGEAPVAAPQQVSISNYGDMQAPQALPQAVPVLAPSAPTADSMGLPPVPFSE